MNQSIQVILILIFSSTSQTDFSVECFPDKGIKTAITSGTISNGDSSKKKKLQNQQKIEYNIDGQPTCILDSKDASEYIREYRDGKLQLIISKRKKLPDFYQSNQLDSLLANAEFQSDTAVIISHNKDGRPFEMIDSEGWTWIFEYNDCAEELITTLLANGDTLQQVSNKNENGVLIESTWTPFQPVKSDIKTEYYGYKFNRRGHWIKRKYETRKGIVTEKRRLIYY